MPNPGQRFLQPNSNHRSMSTSSHSAVPQQRLQRCFVCYNEFTPFKLTTDRWESNMIKMFYSALNLPAPDDGGDDEDEDPVISLPFCPQCHSKISVMSSLHGQLQLIQAQFSNIRNDVVFTIVETNGMNCRKGPMDFIRQQIYDKWKPRYDEAKEKAYFDQPVGLDAIATEAGMAVKRSQEEFLYPDSEDNSLMGEFTNSLGLAVSPFGGVADSRFSNSTPNAKKFVNNKRPIKDEPGDHPHHAPSSKRPARSAAAAHFLQYNESSSIAKFREMESVAKTFSNPAMPRLIPMGAQGNRGKRVGRISDESGSAQETRQPSKDLANHDAPQHPVKRISANSFVSKHFVKFGRMKPGPKKQIPMKMKFQPGRRGRPGRPPGWRKPFAQQDDGDDQMDISDSATAEENSFSQDDSAPLTNNEETDNSIAGAGTFCCRLCPKSYYNISRLRRHESLCHPTTKALQCALCPNGFSSILAFRRHMQNQHHQSMLGLSTMTCAICRKVFVKQSTFDYHMTTHESVLHGAANPKSGHAVSGHPTRKKPGPKPRVREISPPMVEDDDIPLAMMRHQAAQGGAQEQIEQNEIADGSEKEDTEEASVDDISTTQIKPPAQKKKKTFFSGTRKRKRRRLPKPENSEANSEPAKKEPAPDRVIIPRGRKFQNVAPVRKSLRRAESSTVAKAEDGEKPEDNDSPMKQEGEEAAVEKNVEQNSDVDKGGKDVDNGGTEEKLGNATVASSEKGKEKPLSRSNSKEQTGDKPSGTKAAGPPPNSDAADGSKEGLNSTKQANSTDSEHARDNSEVEKVNPTKAVVAAADDQEKNTLANGPKSTQDSNRVGVKSEPVNSGEA